MARQHFVTLAVAALVLPTITFAAEFLVGDDAGWTTQTDYEGWTKGKEFLVGDKLVFKYNLGSHNVYEVNEEAYKKCVIPLDGAPPLSSGEDTVTLDSPGPKYFLCGVGLHCEKGGQKLVVDVKQGGTQGPTKGKATTPSQSPASPAAVGSPNQNAAPSESPSSSNVSPNGAPSEFLATTNSPNKAPSPVASDLTAGVSPPAPAMSNSSDGKNGYHILWVIQMTIVALVMS